jgi:hypothetical protein
MLQRWCHNTHYNDSQHSNTQRNDTRHSDAQENDTGQGKITKATLSIYDAEYNTWYSVNTLSNIMLSVVFYGYAE